MMYYDYPYAREDVATDEFEVAEPSPFAVFGKTARYGVGETTIPVLGDTLI